MPKSKTSFKRRMKQRKEWDKRKKWAWRKVDRMMLEMKLQEEGGKDE